MSKRVQENLIAVVFLLVFIGFLVVAMGYGAKTRLVPIPIALVSILLILGQLIVQNVKTELKLSVDSMDLFASNPAAACGAETAESQERGQSSKTLKELTAFGLVLLFMGLILVVGMMPAVFLYVFGYFYFIGKASLVRSVVFAGATFALTYLLFTSILQVHMYKGMLGLM